MSTQGPERVRNGRKTFPHVQVEEGKTLSRWPNTFTPVFFKGGATQWQIDKTHHAEWSSVVEEGAR